MINQKLLFIALIGAISLLGCQKRVKSDFVLDKYEYRPGEMIKITNLDSKKNQIWEILNPNGEIIETKQESNPQFLINILAENGIYTINLYDNEKKKEKDLKRSKNFLVKSTKGRLYIKCWSMVDNSFSAYVDGQFIGNDTYGELEVFIPTGLNYIEVYGRFNTIRETKEIIEGSSTNNNIHF